MRTSCQLLSITCFLTRLMHHLPAHDDILMLSVLSWDKTLFVWRLTLVRRQTKSSSSNGRLVPYTYYGRYFTDGDQQCQPESNKNEEKSNSSCLIMT